MDDEITDERNVDKEADNDEITNTLNTVAGNNEITNAVQTELTCPPEIDETSTPPVRPKILVEHYTQTIFSYTSGQSNTDIIIQLRDQIPDVKLSLENVSTFRDGAGNISVQTDLSLEENKQGPSYLPVPGISIQTTLTCAQNALDKYTQTVFTALDEAKTDSFIQNMLINSYPRYSEIITENNENVIMEHELQNIERNDEEGNQIEADYEGENEVDETINEKNETDETVNEENEVDETVIKENEVDETVKEENEINETDDVDEIISDQEDDLEFTLEANEEDDLQNINNDQQLHHDDDKQGIGELYLDENMEENQMMVSYNDVEIEEYEPNEDDLSLELLVEDETEGWESDNEDDYIDKDVLIEEDDISHEFEEAFKSVAVQTDFSCAQCISEEVLDTFVQTFFSYDPFDSMTHIKRELCREYPQHNDETEIVDEYCLYCQQEYEKKLLTGGGIECELCSDLSCAPNRGIIMKNIGENLDEMIDEETSPEEDEDEIDKTSPKLHSESDELVTKDQNIEVLIETKQLDSKLDSGLPEKHVELFIKEVSDEGMTSVAELEDIAEEPDRLQEDIIEPDKEIVNLDTADDFTLIDENTQEKLTTSADESNEISIEPTRAEEQVMESTEPTLTEEHVMEPTEPTLTQEQVIEPTETISTEEQIIEIPETISTEEQLIELPEPVTDEERVNEATNENFQETLATSVDRSQENIIEPTPTEDVSKEKLIDVTQEVIAGDTAQEISQDETFQASDIQSSTGDDEKIKIESSTTEQLKVLESPSSIEPLVSLIPNKDTSKGLSKRIKIGDDLIYTMPIGNEKELKIVATLRRYQKENEEEIDTNKSIVSKIPDDFELEIYKSKLPCRLMINPPCRFCKSDDPPERLEYMREVVNQAVEVYERELGPISNELDRIKAQLQSMNIQMPERRNRNIDRIPFIKKTDKNISPKKPTVNVKEADKTMNVPMQRIPNNLRHFQRNVMMNPMMYQNPLYPGIYFDMQNQHMNITSGFATESWATLSYHSSQISLKEPKKSDGRRHHDKQKERKHRSRTYDNNSHFEDETMRSPIERNIEDSSNKRKKRKKRGCKKNKMKGMLSEKVDNVFQSGHGIWCEPDENIERIHTINYR